MQPQLPLHPFVALVRDHDLQRVYGVLLTEMYDREDALNVPALPAITNVPVDLPPAKDKKRGGGYTKSTRVKQRTKRLSSKSPSRVLPGYIYELDKNGRVLHLSDVELDAQWVNISFAEKWTAGVFLHFKNIYHDMMRMWGERFSIKKCYNKFSNISRAHSITSLCWMELWIECDGICCICGDPMYFFVPHGESNWDRLAVIDHNHHSKRIRRLISSGCNKGLGALKDDPMVVSRALVYLQSEGNYASGNASSLKL